MIFGQDKRKFERATGDFKIDAILIDPKKPESLFKLDPIWTKDVGGNGLGLVTNVHCAVGSRMNLHFQLPNQSRPIEVKGRVVWSKLDEAAAKQYRIGVAFETIADSDRKAIMDYIHLEAKKQSSGGAS